MGTPEFAVPSLDILLKNGYDVVAVVTATDKPGGRSGRELLQSAVKKYALEKGIPILQPPKLKAPEFLSQLEALRADLQVVVAFRMLPEVVWSMPTLGTINLHGSLLPRYRGAAPINWAVINGDRETGVTTFFIRQEIDTGDIILQKKMAVGENETAGEVHDRMMELGAQAVLETVQMLGKGNIVLQKQDISLVSQAPKIFHETCEINFNQSAEAVHNFIRGLSPYPGAWTRLRWAAGTDTDRFEGMEVKLLQTRKAQVLAEQPSGEFVTDGKKLLRVSTADGYLDILELQVAGRRKMDAVSFINGLKS